MHYPRWYPTGTTLGDGRVLVTSGANTNVTDLVTIPEVYDAQSNAWSDLSGANRSIPYYPFMYQLPDGRVLQAGASEQATSTLALNVATQQWTTVDSRVIDGGSITNYAPGKFMKAGSASDDGFSGQSSNTAFVLDMNQSNPAWQATGSMANPRSFLNLTNLPDGTVLATGGSTDKSGAIDSNAVKPAEIWDPANGTWRTVAALGDPRLYHSVALLLPDGRVFVSGGGGDAGITDFKSYQIYSPAYLFKGPRPTIASAPGNVQYGATVPVTTPDAANIRRVSLIRTGSVTHAFDQNTRAMALSYTPNAGGLDVQMPVDGNTAPPGYYMLFIVDANGIPSVAAMVRLPAPYEDTVPPSAPGNLVATGGISSVNLGWTAASDNNGVAGYVIYRSTTAGFTPAIGNQVAQIAGTQTSYLDTGLAAGTYYYRVKAQDAASNLGPPSNEANATVTGDVTPPTKPTNLTAMASPGKVALAWTAATDNVGVARYNILRNGTAIGTATSTSYNDTTVAPSTTYSYTVTAQDAAGNVGPPSDPAPVTTPAGTGVPLAIDTSVTTHQSANGTSISSPALTTTSANELLLAFISSDGPDTGSIAISSVTAGGLTWRLRQRSNGQAGTAEIWQAVAPAALSNVVVTATRSSGSWQGAMTVVAFNGADTATDGAVTGSSAANGAPGASLTTTRAGSWVWGVGTDWDTATAHSVGSNQTLVDQYFPPAGDTYWLQRQMSTTPAAGTVVTINDSAPTADRWDLAIIEILPAP
jgi:hypothetical protein